MNAGVINDMRVINGLYDVHEDRSIRQTNRLVLLCSCSVDHITAGA